MVSKAHFPGSAAGSKAGVLSPFVCLCRFWFCVLPSIQEYVAIHFPRIEVLTNSSIPVNRMRGSELQALYLLKQQEFELFKMRNYTALVNKSELSVVNSSTSLNMSANHDAAASPSSSVLEDLKSRIFSQISLNKRIQGVLCHRRKMGIKWICMRITRMRIFGLEQVWEGGSEHMFLLLCLIGLGDPECKEVRRFSLALSKIEAVWEEDVKQPKQRTAQDILEMFSSDEMLLQLEMCSLLMSTDSGVQQNLFNGFQQCQATKVVFTLFPQAADCINRVVERANSPVIYLSTDAADSETGLLQSLVVWNGKTIPLVQRPAVNSAEKWDALLYRHGLEGDSQLGEHILHDKKSMDSALILTSLYSN
ncbi:UNVERIFIED_CONTAM: O-fucosyltransferase 5 [Sesamum latifolium]|uniref:O-fucosyltransferase 5 n=1 Tax=Sesamum latifolium TaxID=2727402 RepID=A0AAW2S3L3_9LAMI